MSPLPSIEKLQKALLRATPSPLKPIVGFLIESLQWCLFLSSSSSLLLDRDIVKESWQWLQDASPALLKTLLDILGHALSATVIIWRAISHPLLSLVEELISIQIEQWQFDLVTVVFLAMASFVRVVALRRKIIRLQGRFEKARQIVTPRTSQTVSVPPVDIEGGLILVGEKPPEYPTEFVEQIQIKLKEREKKARAILFSTVVFILIATIVCFIILFDAWLHWD